MDVPLKCRPVLRELLWTDQPQEHQPRPSVSAPTHMREPQKPPSHSEVVFNTPSTVAVSNVTAAAGTGPWLASSASTSPATTHIAGDEGCGGRMSFAGQNSCLQVYLFAGAWGEPLLLSLELLSTASRSRHSGHSADAGARLFDCGTELYEKNVHQAFTIYACLHPSCSLLKYTQAGSLPGHKLVWLFCR